jgi:hypothetical protein
MNKENSKILIPILLFMCFLFLLKAGSEKKNKNEDDLKGECILTIGRITEDKGRSHGLYYKYFVNHKLYYSSTSENYNTATYYDRFYTVRYVKAKPYISEIYLNDEITDTIKIIATGYRSVHIKK